MERIWSDTNEVVFRARLWSLSCVADTQDLRPGYNSAVPNRHDLTNHGPSIRLAPCTDLHGERRAFRPAAPGQQDYIRSSTVVAIVMRVPLITPTMCVVRLKEVS